jgi:hypothetical protein
MIGCRFLLESAFLYSFLVKHYSSKPTGGTGEEEEEGDQEEEGHGQPNLAREAHESSALLLGSHAKAQLKSRVDELSKMEMFLQVKVNPNGWVAQIISAPQMFFFLTMIKY